MVWSEQAISEHLGLSRFRMVWDCGYCDVIDVNAMGAQAGKPKVTWTNEELVKLVICKRRGDTMDEIEASLGRERKRIQDKWTHRAEWMSGISVPDEPTVIKDPAARKDIIYSAIVSLTEATCDPVLQMRMDDIAKAVCTVYGIDRNELSSPRRARKLSNARHVCFWIARKFTSYSFPLIGRVCGDKDHSTVMHGVQRVEREFDKFSDKIVSALELLGVKHEVAR